MGRTEKQILNDEGIDRRELGYYATPSYVASFIKESLLVACPNARSAFDPCIGKGELAVPFLDSNIHFSGMDVYTHALPDGISFEQGDFIQFARSYLETNQQPLDVDLWIANPPYNCHEHDYLRRHRKEYRDFFGPSATLNMYALFLVAMLRLAKPGAFLGILTLDSFLTARGYEALRHELLARCTLRKILLCPLNLFHEQGAEVRTCYIELERNDSRQYDEILVLNRLEHRGEFKRALQERNFSKRSYRQSVLSDARDRSEFLIDIPEDVLRLFHGQRVQDVAPCVTGISTGNDSLYLREKADPCYSVAFYKNPGKKKFYCSPDAFLITDYEGACQQSTSFLVRNRNYLGREGITCSSMGVAFSACYRPEGACFGVNANIIVTGRALWTLMAYLNSSLVSYLVRGVLIRSNMITSGYVSRIPIPVFTTRVEHELARIAHNAWSKQVSPEESALYVDAIDTVLKESLLLSEESWNTVDRFVSTIVKST